MKILTCITDSNKETKTKVKGPVPELLHCFHLFWLKYGTRIGQKEGRTGRTEFHGQARWRLLSTYLVGVSYIVVFE